MLAKYNIYKCFGLELRTFTRIYFYSQRSSTFSCFSNHLMQDCFLICLWSPLTVFPPFDLHSEQPLCIQKLPGLCSSVKSSLWILSFDFCTHCVTEASQETVAFDFVLISLIVVFIQANWSRRTFFFFICGKAILSQECCVFTFSLFPVDGKKIANQNWLKKHISIGPRAHQCRRPACFRYLPVDCHDSSRHSWFPTLQAFTWVLGIQILVLLLWYQVLYSLAISPDFAFAFDADASWMWSVQLLFFFLIFFKNLYFLLVIITIQTLINSFF